MSEKLDRTHAVDSWTHINDSVKAFEERIAPNCERRGILSCQLDQVKSGSVKEWIIYWVYHPNKGIGVQSSGLNLSIGYQCEGLRAQDKVQWLQFLELSLCKDKISIYGRCSARYVLVDREL